MRAFCIIAIVFASASLMAAQECKRPYSPPKASFSVCIPDNFTTFPPTDDTLTFLLDDLVLKKHRLSMTFRELRAHDSARKAADTLVAALTPDGPGGGMLVERGDFNSDSGIQGTRVVAEFDHRDHNHPDSVTRMVHIYYSFQSGEALMSFMAILFQGDSDGVAIADSIARTAKINH